MIDWLKSLAKWLKSQKPGAATKAREALQESKQSRTANRGSPMPWITDVHMTDVDSSFGDFQLEADLVYEDEYGAHWTVPAGFIGDLSSIPAILRPFVSPTILGKTLATRLPLPNAPTGRYTRPRGPPFQNRCGR